MSTVKETLGCQLQMIGGKWWATVKWEGRVLEAQEFGDRDTASDWLHDKREFHLQRLSR